MHLNITEKGWKGRRGCLLCPLVTKLMFILSDNPHLLDTGNVCRVLNKKVVVGQGRVGVAVSSDLNKTHAIQRNTFSCQGKESSGVDRKGGAAHTLPTP